MKNYTALKMFASHGVSLVDPRFYAQVCASLAEVPSELMAGMPVATAEDDFFDPESHNAHYRPYEVKDGTLVVPIKGVLLNNFPYQLGSWATGYEYLKQVFRRAENDQNVERVALLTDSYGGVVDECFPCADALAALTQVKPVKAFAKNAYSAAYAMVCVADSIVVSPVTGGVGSIGVRYDHVEFSKYLAEVGIKHTHIVFGDLKADAVDTQPLSKRAMERIQADVDRLGGIFVAHVAKNRGLDAAAVKATEAGWFVAEEALAIGLADSVGSLEDALIEFEEETATLIERTTEMKTPVKTSATATAAEPTAAELAAQEVAVNETAAALIEQGETNMRNLLSEVTALESAKGNYEMAVQLVCTPGMTVASADKILAKVPAQAAAPKAEEPKAAAPKLDTKMAKGNPDIADENPGAEDEKPNAQSVADRIAANYRAARGLPPK